MIDPQSDEETSGEVVTSRSPWSALPAWVSACALLAAAAAVLLPPVAESGLVALIETEAPQGVDAIVTGTVAPRHQRYTVHRSVLHPAGETCTVFPDGRARGAC